MQEDVLGPREDSFGPKVSTCGECGRTSPRRAMHPEPSGLLDAAVSEFTDVCDECERLDLAGERPVTIAADDGR